MPPDAAGRLAVLGLGIPGLLLPKAGTDLSRWAVIACDQFTQDRNAWERIRRAAGKGPSTLDLIYPEVYLEDPGGEERIAIIHRTMKRYLTEGVFAPPFHAPVYVERDTPFYRGRQGLMIALDLESYNWQGAASLVRPTEGIVPERLPPRIAVRRNAPLETPHILVLIDDEANVLFPALAEWVREPTRHGGGKPIYDTELMLDSGRVRGWKLDGAGGGLLAGGLEKLFRRRAEEAGGAEGRDGTAPFLYAVGDGNHSLAAARSVWEEYKAARRGEPDLMNHSARWALVEIENLYDPALRFEPIHRLVFGSTAEDILGLLADLPGYRCRPLGSAAGTLEGPAAELAALVQDDSGPLRFGVVSGGDCFLAEADPIPLAVDVLQPLLDRFLAAPPEAVRQKPGIDYIHGTEELFRLAGTGGSCLSGGTPGVPKTGILLPPFRKQGLFETVARRGPLPRKSFSLGESREKRFYLECRRLFG
jgi:hypothetical protein